MTKLPLFLHFVLAFVIYFYCSFCVLSVKLCMNHKCKEILDTLQKPAVETGAGLAAPQGGPSTRISPATSIQMNGTLPFIKIL